MGCPAQRWIIQPLPWSWSIPSSRAVQADPLHGAHQRVTAPMAEAHGLLGLRQRLQPQSQDVTGSIEITIDLQTTARTEVDTLRQRQVLPMPARWVATVLRRVGGVDLDELATGAFCLVRQQREELPPRCIMNGLGETMVVDHLLDGTILNADDAVCVNHLTGFLMCEIAAAVGNALVHKRLDLPSLASQYAALGRFLPATLRPLETTLIAAQETGSANLLTIGQCRKGSQAHVKPHSALSSFQDRRLNVAGEGHIPFPRAGPTHATGLDLSLKGTMEDGFDSANARQVHTLAHDLEARLRVAERIVAALPPKSGIAGLFLSCPYAPQEGGEGQVDASRHVLQDLSIHCGQTGTLPFKSR